MMAQPSKKNRRAHVSEWAVMIALVSVVVISSLLLFNDKLRNITDKISNALSSLSSDSGIQQEMK